jgi:CheY-like chemotaxis protein
VDLQVINDGERAVDYLLSHPEVEPWDLAQVILLDLSLPRVGGLEILRRLKENPRLNDIPVVILSGTQNDEDIRAGQELKAYSHIIKPMRQSEFDRIARTVTAYWPTIRRLRALDKAS